MCVCMRVRMCVCACMCVRVCARYNLLHAHALAHTHEKTHLKMGCFSSSSMPPPNRADPSALSFRALRRGEALVPCAQITNMIICEKSIQRTLSSRAMPTHTPSGRASTGTRRGSHLRACGPSTPAGLDVRLKSPPILLTLLYACVCDSVLIGQLQIVQCCLKIDQDVDACTWAIA